MNFKINKKIILVIVATIIIYVLQFHAWTSAEFFNFLYILGGIALIFLVVFLGLFL